MAGMTWGDGAMIATCPVADPGVRLTLSSTGTDGAFPVLNVSCPAPLAALCQPRIDGGTPADGKNFQYGFGCAVGTIRDDRGRCHAFRAAPWANGLPNGPLAVAATARDSMRRLAFGADVGFAGSYSGRA